MLVVLTMLFASCGGRGAFGRDFFARQLEQLDPWFEACYARVLRRSRDTEGVITLRMQGKGGKLLSSIVQNETGNAGLGDCMQQAVSNLDLVEPAGGEPWDFTVEWPVTFTIIRRH
jgi:hypothetical protein